MDISLVLLELVQNSLEANSSLVEIKLTEDTSSIELTVADDGCSVDNHVLGSLCLPGFSTKGEHRGMGLFEVKSLAEKTGGGLSIEAVSGKGTRVRARFIKNKFCPPMGNVNLTVRTLMLCGNETEIFYKRGYLERSFGLDTRAMKLGLGSVPLLSAEVCEWIRDYLDEQTQIIYGGAVDEITG